MISTRRDILKQLLSTIAFVLVLVITYLISTHYLRPIQVGFEPIEEESPASIDVLFLGTSHSYYGVSPMEIWDVSGIPTFNYGSPGQPAFMSEVYLQNALKVQKPKLVMFEIYGLTRTPYQDSSADKTISKDYEERVQQGYTRLPLSRLKLGNIITATDRSLWKSEAFALRRGSTLLESANERELRYTNTELESLKGYEPHFETIAPDVLEDFSPEPQKMSAEMDETYQENLTYVKRMAAECKKRGIPFVLFALPYSFEEQADMLGRLERDLKEYPNVAFLDMNDDIERLAIHPESDFLNGVTKNGPSNIHLNHRGATKVSLGLAEYFKDTYGLSSRKNEKAYKMWGAFLTEYRETLKERE